MCQSVVAQALHVQHPALRHVDDALGEDFASVERLGRISKGPPAACNEAHAASKASQIARVCIASKHALVCSNECTGMSAPERGPPRLQGTLQYAVSSTVRSEIVGTLPHARQCFLPPCCKGASAPAGCAESATYSLMANNTRGWARITTANGVVRSASPAGLCHRRRWLRDQSRSRLQSGERAMTSRNKLLSSLSTDDFALVGAASRACHARHSKVLEKPNRRINCCLLPRSRVCLRRREAGQRQRGRGRTDRAGGHDRNADRARQSSLASRHLHPGRRRWPLHPSDRLAPGNTVQPIPPRPLLKFVQAFGVQTTHTAISNARSKLDQRLARWLLMAHDRLETDGLPLTDEFLSLMLAVRRAGVTEAVHALEVRGLIARTRGQINVRNRQGLERVAGASYGVPEAEYRRLIN